MNMRGEKCECNVGVGLFGLILMTAGFYFFVTGFLAQVGGASAQFSWNWWALLYYLIGFLLTAFGKISKHKACGGCGVHMHMHN